VAPQPAGPLGAAGDSALHRGRSGNPPTSGAPQTRGRTIPLASSPERWSPIEDDGANPRAGDPPSRDAQRGITRATVAQRRDRRGTAIGRRGLAPAQARAGRATYPSSRHYTKHPVVWPAPQPRPTATRRSRVPMRCTASFGCRRASSRRSAGPREGPSVLTAAPNARARGANRPRLRHDHLPRRPKAIGFRPRFPVERRQSPGGIPLHQRGRSPGVPLSQRDRHAAPARCSVSTRAPQAREGNPGRALGAALSGYDASRSRGPGGTVGRGSVSRRLRQTRDPVGSSARTF
jgi:hypothetical protein